MALSAASPPSPTSSTDPESFVAARHGKPSLASASSPSSSTRRCTTTVLASLIILTAAGAAGVAFSVVATAVLRLRVEGDLPSRVLVFAASSLSLVYAGLHVAAVVIGRPRGLSRGKPTGLQTTALLVSRVLLVAWVAAVVLTSLLIAQRGALSPLSAPLADQAVYLNLLVAGVALLASGTLSFSLEGKRSPFKASQRRALISSPKLLRQPQQKQQQQQQQQSQQASFSEELEPVDLTDDDLADKIRDDDGSDQDQDQPRPKKLLFSYKTTTQLIDEKPRRSSMATVATAATVGTLPAAIVFSNPFDDSNRIDRPAPTRNTRHLSTLPAQASLPRLITRKSVMGSSTTTTTTTTTTQPAFTFYLSPTDTSSDSDAEGDSDSGSRGGVSRDKPNRRNSGNTRSANYSNSKSSRGSSSGSNRFKDGAFANPSRAAIVPSSPAVVRPTSIVPPMPHVPAVARASEQSRPAAQSSQNSHSNNSPIRRKPIGSGDSPIKRKPVPAKAQRSNSGTQSQQPSSTRTLRLSAMLAASSLTRGPSDRKSSVASTESTASTSALPAAAAMSLVDMVVSSLRPDSVFGVTAGQSGGSRPYDLPEGPSAAATAMYVAPPPTHAVAYAQPRMYDQPIIRKSFVAMTGNNSSNHTGYNSYNSSRRPSEVSIMDTIYSPADGEEERAEQRYEEEEHVRSHNRVASSYSDIDGELAAMMRRQDEAAFAAADAGRLLEQASYSLAAAAAVTGVVPESLPPSASDSNSHNLTLHAPKHERKMSVSKRPSLSPVAEREPELEREEVLPEARAEAKLEPHLEKTAKQPEQLESPADEDGPSSSRHTIVVHEPTGFTASGLSRTARRMRKAALQAMAASGMGSSGQSGSPRYVPAYTRRRLSAGYNFSRPMRAGSGSSSNSGSSGNSANGSSSAGTLPVGSAVLSPRSCVRRQLLQMLPPQYQPQAADKADKAYKAQKATKPRVSLSGRRQRRSLSLDLSSANAIDDEWESDSSDDSSEEEESADDGARRSLARSAQRAHQRNVRRDRGGTGVGLRRSTMRRMMWTLSSSTAGGGSGNSAGGDRRLSRLSPHTPHNRPISPMTLLMERSLR